MYEKCQGLPLALELVGKLLKSKTGVQDDENGNIQSLEMLRHFSFVSQQFGSYSKFKELEGARKFANFIAIATNVYDRVVPFEIFVCPLVNRSLLLHGCEKLVSLPKSFAKLGKPLTHGCQNCEYLPKLRCMGSLKRLFVEGMPMALELFPSLEVLELEDMQGWENWSVNNDNSDGSTILFHKCPSILAEKLEDSLFTCIKKLVIHNCQSIEELLFPQGQNLPLILDI
ncbi:hypothetical protein Tco_1394374 [Tanacetum coccineum]